MYHVSLNWTLISWDILLHGLLVAEATGISISWHQGTLPNLGSGVREQTLNRKDSQERVGPGQWIALCFMD